MGKLAALQLRQCQDTAKCKCSMLSAVQRALHRAAVNCGTYTVTLPPERLQQLETAPGDHLLQHMYVSVRDSIYDVKVPEQNWVSYNCLNCLSLNVGQFEQWKRAPAWQYMVTEAPERADDNGLQV